MAVEITRVRGRLTFEQIGKVKQIFKDFDHNASNTFEVDEFRQFLLRFDISLDDSSLEGLMAAMDDNCSGVIEFGELLDWFPTILAMKRAGQFKPPIATRNSGANAPATGGCSSPAAEGAATTTSGSSGQFLFHNRNVNWAEVREKLPYSKTSEEEKARRQDLFDRIDCNGNGYLSLAEVDKGVRDEIKLPSVYHTKPVIMRAFQAAKDAHQSHTTRSGQSLGPNYVEASEFRLLLKYLYGYFQIWEAFESVDTDGDRRVSKDEFIAAFGNFVTWGLVKSGDDPSAVFTQMDVNKGGYVLFDELASWTLKRSLLSDE